MAQQESTADQIKAYSISVGNNPNLTIPESAIPEAVGFRADENIDWIEHVEITAANDTNVSVTGDISVNLYQGVDTTGQLLQSETQSFTVEPDRRSKKNFLTKESTSNVNYFIETVSDNSTLTVDRIDIQTTAAEYNRQKFSNGDEVWTDHEGRERLRLPADANEVRVPKIVDQSQTISSEWPTQGDIVPLGNWSIVGQETTSSTWSVVNPVGQSAVINPDDYTYSGIGDLYVSYTGNMNTDGDGAVEARMYDLTNNNTYALTELRETSSSFQPLSSSRELLTHSGVPLQMGFEMFTEGTSGRLHNPQIKLWGETV